MKNKAWGIFFVAFAFLLMGGGAVWSADPILIGLMAPMSGDYAEYGMFFKEGIGLAIDEINKAGGVQGRMIEPVIGDSRADPKEAALVAQKFVANPKILAVIGDFTSSCAMAAAPMGNPGWPDFAFWTPSMASVRIVLMQSWSTDEVFRGFSPSISKHLEVYLRQITFRRATKIEKDSQKSKMCVDAGSSYRCDQKVVSQRHSRPQTLLLGTST
jgi:hypothetical protein